MTSSANSTLRIRDLGYSPGSIPTGPKNSILDVPGVTIGQATKVVGKSVRSGVTVLLPRGGEGMLEPCYAGMHTLNGNGEVTGSYQIKDWGFVNMPIALTNSTSLGIVFHTIWQHVLKTQASKSPPIPISQMGRDYGTPVVGETADWWLNDVYKSTLSIADVEEALEIATSGKQTEVLEGQHGGGAGMTCHQFTAGTGTSSRLVDGEKDGETIKGKYTVGVLCQSNYGHKPFLRIGGVPIGQLLMKEDEEAAKKVVDEKSGGKVGEGSIVIIIFTDAPMMPHQLIRLAQRAGIGLAQVGSYGVARCHSGDIFLAVSTANKHSEQLKGPTPYHFQPRIETNTLEVMKNECVDGIFRAAIEATEEAILNSLVAGREGRAGYEGLPDGLAGMPVDRVRELLKKHLVVV